MVQISPNDIENNRDIEKRNSNTVLPYFEKINEYPNMQIRQRDSTEIESQDNNTFCSCVLSVIIIIIIIVIIVVSV